MKKKKVIVTGAAGTVGQNLMFELENKYDVIAIDMHKYNLELFKKYHPKVKTLLADISKKDFWEEEFKNTDLLVTLHAQISGKSNDPFIKNNIQATKNVLEVAKKNKIKYLVHLSSSVVISVAKDDYTNTKKQQEDIVHNAGISHVIFRPPLMFGWFDKKHLGWISRFMAKTPIFPIPGNGKYIRQPLFVRDICKVVASALKKQPKNKIYNIIGKEKIPYIDLMRKIKKYKKLKTVILPIPKWLFVFLMRLYGFFTRNPPFTPDQLKALTAGDTFSVSNWDKEFGVKYTPIDEAFKITFQGKYADVVCRP